MFHPSYSACGQKHVKEGASTHGVLAPTRHMLGQLRRGGKNHLRFHLLLEHDVEHVVESFVVSIHPPGGRRSLLDSPAHVAGHVATENCRVSRHPPQTIDIGRNAQSTLDEADRSLQHLGRVDGPADIEGHEHLARCGMQRHRTMSEQLHLSISLLEGLRDAHQIPHESAFTEDESSAGDEVVDAVLGVFARERGDCEPGTVRHKRPPEDPVIVIDRRRVRPQWDRSGPRLKQPRPERAHEHVRHRDGVAIGPHEIEQDPFVESVLPRGEEKHIRLFTCHLAAPVLGYIESEPL